MKKILGIWFCGLSGSGKSYASILLEKLIFNSIKIEGDTVRKFLSADLGYSRKDRIESARRNLEIAKILIFEKKFPLISNAYLPQKIINQAQDANIKVYKVIRHTKTNVKFSEDDKNVLGKDLEFEKLNSSEIINDENFDKKLIELTKLYSLKEN